jgi:transcriptional regulator with XRE-family HTH domain
MEMIEAVGLAVRRVRRQRQWSQEQLAAEALLHRTYISDIERGVRNASLTSLVRIASALEVKLSRLIAIAEQIDSAQRK